jgi:hypothetical protein
MICTGGQRFPGKIEIFGKIGAIREIGYYNTVSKWAASERKRLSAVSAGRTCFSGLIGPVRALFCGGAVASGRQAFRLGVRGAFAERTGLPPGPSRGVGRKRSAGAAGMRLGTPGGEPPDRLADGLVCRPEPFHGARWHGKKSKSHHVERQGGRHRGPSTQRVRDHGPVTRTLETRSSQRPQRISQKTPPLCLSVSEPTN